MEDFQDHRVGQQPMEVRRLPLPLGDADDVDVAIAGRELHQAQPVAMRVQPHRLRVHGDRIAIIREVGQVPLVETDRHRTALCRNAAPRPIWAAAPRA